MNTLKLNACPCEEKYTKEKYEAKQSALNKVTELSSNNKTLLKEIQADEYSLPPRVLYELANLVFYLEDNDVKNRAINDTELLLTRTILGFFDKFAIDPSIQIKCNQAVYDSSAAKIAKAVTSHTNDQVRPDLVVFKDSFPIIFEEDKASANPADDFDKGFTFASSALKFFPKQSLCF